MRYDGQELALVRQAAGAAGLRTGGYVASAALSMAQQLLEHDPVRGVAPVGPGQPRVLADSEDRVLLAELIQARLALGGTA